MMLGGSWMHLPEIVMDINDRTLCILGIRSY